MNINRWKLVQNLFEMLLDLPQEQRAAYLRSHSGGDQEIVREVMNLLAGDEQASGLFSNMAEDASNLLNGYDLIGRQLGTFRIIKRLGEGGMGEVYLASDPVSGDKVALKFLPPYCSSNPRLRSRFISEMTSIKSLSHPNIIRIIEHSTFTGILHFAMEYAEHGSLAHLINRRRRIAGDGEDAARINSASYNLLTLTKFIRLAEALDYIHSEGILHRDIKPDNILIAGPEMEYKLADFGIACTDDMTRLTRAGEFVGTIRYVAPELLTDSQSLPNVRSDIYSLGVTLYEALTLSTPFDSRGEVGLIADIIAGKVIEPRRRNSRLSDEIEKIILKAISTNPDKRYANGAAFATAMKNVLEGKTAMAIGQDRLKRCHGRTKILAANFVLLVVVFFLYMFEPGNTPDIESATTMRTPLSDTITHWGEKFAHDFEGGFLAADWASITTGGGYSARQYLDFAKAGCGGRKNIALSKPANAIWGDLNIHVNLELVSR